MKCGLNQKALIAAQEAYLKASEDDGGYSVPLEFLPAAITAYLEELERQATLEQSGQDEDDGA